LEATLLQTRKLLVIAALGATFVACSDEAPNNPTVIATPTPAPTPTPTPAPTPTPTPAALTCRLSSMPDCGANCCTKGGNPAFESEIEEAQDELRRRKPELFNSNGSLKVDEDEYTTELAKLITSMFGLCATGGTAGHGGSISDDEVAIKRDNGMSQNTDVIAGYNNSPYVGGVYTCRPASF
jgi:hypothetical protein